MKTKIKRKKNNKLRNSRKSRKHMKDGNKKYTAVIVEPRKHKALEFVLKNILENLNNDWNILIIHGNLNKEFIEDIIKNTLSKYKNRIILTQMNKDNLSKEEYNQFIVSDEYFNAIPTDTFLRFELDSMINPKNKDRINNFLKYDLVGAPWDFPHNSNHALKGIVGNGGFTLRKKSRMLEILKACPYPHNDKSFSSENVYFTHCDKVTLNRPSFEEAKKFASETVIDSESFGLHKPWVHHKNIDELESIFPGIKELYDLQN
jgi:hypothetical protein